MPINVTFFATTADVREKAQSILSEDFANTEIEKEQESAVDIIRTEVGTYDQNHAKIMSLKKIEIYLAASFLLDHFEASKEDADRLYNRGMDLLNRLKTTLIGTGQDVGLLMASSTYQTIPAARLEDPATTVKFYKSTRSYIGLQPREIDDPENPLIDSDTPERLMNPGDTKDWY